LTQHAVIGIPDRSWSGVMHQGGRVYDWNAFQPTFIALLLDLQADMSNAGDKYMFLEHIVSKLFHGAKKIASLMKHDWLTHQHVIIA
jgi:hypothetical protein